MSKDKEIIPRADMLMGSMRSMGYSFESAVADIIDNSISAQSKDIRILFPMDPLDKMAVGILDDGIGMSKDVLEEAMRYGSTSSEEIRDENDLGRFGLGLKAASLSQCKILTVVSIHEGKTAAYSWDYNYIKEKKNWIVKQLSSTEIKKLPYIDELIGNHNGTLVLWQDFDILEKSSEGLVLNTLNTYKASLEDALALIFHRFLSASAGKKITISINSHKIKPQDPFLETHPKTTMKKERTIAIKDSTGIERQILIKPFVLPFASDLTDKDKKLIGGVENMRLRQGFYIYRNNRLIIWGTWFGMKPRAELTKNARIRVDIPNSLDDIWSIDIKKQTAAIPHRIKQQLKNTVIKALEISTAKQTHRGRKEKVDDKIDYIWDRLQGRNESFYYQINRDSKLFQFVKDQMSEKDFDLLQMFLNEVEKNIPFQQMYIDQANNKIKPEINSDRSDEIYQLSITMIEQIHQFHQRPYKDIIDDLCKSEPFCNNNQLKDLLINSYCHETE